MDLPSLLPGWLREPAAGDVADRGPEPRTARDRIVDIACVVTSLAVGTLAFRSGNHGVLPVPLRAVDLLGCSLLLWWRRRWPVAGALIATVGYALSSAALVPWHILLFTVTVRRRARLAVLIATVHLGVSVAVNYDENTLMPWWSYELLKLGLIVTVIVLGLLVRARRRSVLVWRDRAWRAEHQRHQRMNQARQLERTRIAREMHDVLGHRLSLLAVHAGALECRPDADPDQITASAGVIRDNAHQALEELRDVIGVLGEDDPDGASADAGRPQPGLDAIPALITESTRAGARIRYRDVPGPGTTDGDPVCPTLARTVYRVVQESLTNARKHAPGAAVDVTVATGDREIVVEVANPLPLQPPRHPVPGSGTGLVGLGERVQLAGGRLTHRITPEGSFVLRAELPRRRPT